VRRRTLTWLLAGRRAERIVFALLFAMECAAGVLAIKFLHRNAR
jgi:hypothetical protein